jgi:transcriptional repressor NrdR
MVVKKDGRRVPWDKESILRGLERACFKRPVPEPELLRVADEVEEEVFGSYDREVPSAVIGQLVTDRLRRIDQVAYVRFASVYRQFKTLEELVEEARAVIDAKRFEDPGQGRLFVDPAARPATPNGADRDAVARSAADPAAGGRTGAPAARREPRAPRPRAKVPAADQP